MNNTKEIGKIQNKLRRAIKRKQFLEIRIKNWIKKIEELEKTTTENFEFKPKFLTEHCLDVINESRSPMFPMDILNKLEGRGYRFYKKSDPYVRIFVTCTRLAQKQEVKRIKLHGKIAFSKI